MQFSMQGVLVAVIFIACASACPTGYGCYRAPPGCGETTMCEMYISWKLNNADGIDFGVNYKSTDATKARWAAIGFSLDGKMGDDDILMCRQTTADINTVVVEHYWSIGESVMKETPDGLSNIVTGFTDGYLRCNFTRALSVPGKSRVYDLAETTTADMMPKYYFVAGSGAVSNEVPVQHDVNPFHTSEGVDFAAAKELIKAGHGSSEEGGDASSNLASALVLATALCIGFLFKY